MNLIRRRKKMKVDIVYICIDRSVYPAGLLCGVCLYFGPVTCMPAPAGIVCLFFALSLFARNKASAWVSSSLRSSSSFPPLGCTLRGAGLLFEGEFGSALGDRVGERIVVVDNAEEEEEDVLLWLLVLLLLLVMMVAGLKEVLIVRPLGSWRVATETVQTKEMIS